MTATIRELLADVAAFQFSTVKEQQGYPEALRQLCALKRRAATALAERDVVLELRAAGRRLVTASLASKQSKLDRWSSSGIQKKSLPMVRQT